MRSFAISVFGPKAGVGKTILATNVAHALARQSRGRVLLVDFDPHDCGDIAILLGMRLTTSFVELSPGVHKLTAQNLGKKIDKHHTGIWVLPAARKLEQVELISSDSLERLLDLCRQSFQYIVFDCGSDIHSLPLKAFELSSLILFCTTPEILTLSRSVHSLNSFQSLAFPSDLIQLVVNRFDPKGVITETIIRQKLQKESLAFLPDEEEEIQNSIHQGTPIFVSRPRSPYSKVVDKMCRYILSTNLLKPVKELNLKSSFGTSSPMPNVLVDLGKKKPRSSEKLTEEIDRLDDIRMRIHQRLIEVMDFRKLSTDELIKQDEKALADLHVKTRDAIFRIMDRMPEIRSRDERQRLAKEVLDEALGLGPLEDLLADPEISEILVNSHSQIYVEKKGRLSLTDYRFTSDRHLLGVIERIVAPIGRRIDEKTPMVDARLHDGSRVHAIIPPLALDGPMLTIRKFSQNILGPKHLIQLGAMTEEIGDFLRACVQARLNILISGGTGTGKTTLLNILASFIPSHERILTVEDSAELRLSQEHVGRLEARPANLQGEGAIPIRELVRNTLRMRPDRIVVGECRGAEALDMLQAMNTGHDGSMTTIHANSPRDCMSRLETLVMFAGMELPSRAIREQIASAIQLVVQLTRLGDGSRKITSITEVTGLEGTNIELQEIFRYREKGMDEKGTMIGSFQATGLVPSFADHFKQKGIKMPKGIFGRK